MRRNNPVTGKPFKRGDTRADGFSFVRYKTDQPKKLDGFFVEVWRRPQSEDEGKKRINEATGKPFKRGDFDPSTGKFFWGWDSAGSDANGNRYEVWASRESFLKQKKKLLEHNQRYKAKRKKQVANGEYLRRLNPKTGQEFKRGEIDEEGRIFITYTSNTTTNGYVGEEWASYDSFVRRQIAGAKKAAMERAKSKGVPFSLTHQYLVSIYPEDEICPIFGTKMEWLGNQQNSPSLDRIIPSLGYVEENVAWVSKRANTLKLDRSPKVLRQIADWVEKQVSTNEAH